MNEKKLASYALVLSGQGPNMQLLVVKRPNPAYEDKWAFPGGMLDGRTDPLDSCVEDLARQTGLVLHRNMAVELSVRKNKERDPRGEVEAHPYVFYIDDPKELKVDEKIQKVRWISIFVIKNFAMDLGAILCEAMGKFWSQMPSFDISFKKIELPQVFVKKKLDRLNDEMIFYGGSFNPWHPGHLECLKICPTDNIIIVPDYNPWKETNYHGERCFWTEYHDLCMKLKDTPYAIYPGFWGLEDSNPTINWIPNIRVETKGLLLGDDSFCNILNWKDSEVLITFVNTIYVAPRIHKREEMESVKSKVLEIHPNMKIEILKEHEFMQESSTLIREREKNI